MNSKTDPARSRLAELLPGHQTGEYHHDVVAAPRERVWDALHALSWADLRIGKPFVLLRGLTVMTRHDRTFLSTFLAVGAAEEAAPERAVVVMIGKPWLPVPTHRELTAAADVTAFAEPGWLKYGMEWVLTDLGDGRTLVETRTLNEATDDVARRRFAAYWALIRVPSGLIRRDLLAALRRRTEEPDRTDCR